MPVPISSHPHPYPIILSTSLFPFPFCPHLLPILPLSSSCFHLIPAPCSLNTLNVHGNTNQPWPCQTLSSEPGRGPKGSSGYQHGGGNGEGPGPDAWDELQQVLRWDCRGGVREIPEDLQGKGSSAQNTLEHPCPLLRVPACPTLLCHPALHHRHPSSCLCATASAPGCSTGPSAAPRNSCSRFRHYEKPKDSSAGGGGDEIPLPGSQHLPGCFTAWHSP